MPGGCHHPVTVENDAGRQMVIRCKSSRSSKCPTCAERKRRDIATVGRSGWIDNPRDRGYFVTLTAPGAKVLPWDTSKCGHGPGECSGSLGCVVDEYALAAWHDSLPQRWSWFMTDLRRELGIDVEFFKTYEPQQREALHIHSMMRPEGVVTDRRFRAALRLCAARWGFGSQLDVQMVDLSDDRDVARKAGYCAKYASKSADSLPAITRLNISTGEVRQGGMRSWSASWNWGETMKAIAARRRAWAVGNGGTRGNASASSLGGPTGPTAAVANGNRLDPQLNFYAALWAGSSDQLL